MTTQAPSPSAPRHDRPHPAHTARVAAAVISMGTFGVIAGALAANASADHSAKATSDQPTTTITTTSTVPGWGDERGEDAYEADDGTTTEQSPWSAQPGVPPSGGVPQQEPSTQSNGS